MNEWIKWEGGERPVPEGTRVVIRYRDGTEYSNVAPPDFVWKHSLDSDHAADVVAYKLHQVEAPVVLPTGFKFAPFKDKEASHLAVLRELMQRFDLEAWNCPRCGHSEETKTMDSATFLREYLEGLEK